MGRHRLPRVDKRTDEEASGAAGRSKRATGMPAANVGQSLSPALYAGPSGGARTAPEDAADSLTGITARKEHTRSATFDFLALDQHRAFRDDPLAGCQAFENTHLIRRKIRRF